MRRVFGVYSVLVITLGFTQCSAVNGDEPALFVQKLPPEVVELVKDSLTRHSPGATISEHADSLSATFHLRDYVVHGQLKNGRRRASHVLQGPDQDGFVMTLRAVPPNTKELIRSGPFGDHYSGRVLAEEFWKRYYTLYEMPEGWYIELRCSYGANCDPAILSEVRSLVARVGKEVYQPDPRAWDDAIASLREKLDKLWADTPVKPAWVESESGWTCELNVQEYDVHRIDQHGHVSDTTHRGKGPQADGLIIRFTRTDVGTLSFAAPSFGHERKLYWDHYYFAGSLKTASMDNLRMDVLLGNRASRDMFKQVVSAVEEVVNLPRRF